MTTEILIGKTPVKLCGNAATAVRYKQIFHKDLLMSFRAMSTEDFDADIIKELAFVMQMQADGKDFKGITFDDYCEWLTQFEESEILTNAADIINTWMTNTQTMTKAKKK